MAAKEIKSISVKPSTEESTINLWQSFGWELNLFKLLRSIKIFTLVTVFGFLIFACSQSSGDVGNSSDDNDSEGWSAYGAGGMT